MIIKIDYYARLVYFTHFLTGCSLAIVLANPCLSMSMFLNAVTRTAQDALPVSSHLVIMALC